MLSDEVSLVLLETNIHRRDTRGVAPLPGFQAPIAPPTTAPGPRGGSSHGRGGNRGRGGFRGGY